MTRSIKRAVNTAAMRAALQPSLLPITRFRTPTPVIALNFGHDIQAREFIAIECDGHMRQEARDFGQEYRRRLQATKIRFLEARVRSRCAALLIRCCLVSRYRRLLRDG